MAIRLIILSIGACLLLTGCFESEKQIFSAQDSDRNVPDSIIDTLAKYNNDATIQAGKDGVFTYKIDNITCRFGMKKLSEDKHSSGRILSSIYAVFNIEPNCTGDMALPWHVYIGKFYYPGHEKYPDGTVLWSFTSDGVIPLAKSEGVTLTFIQSESAEGVYRILDGWDKAKHFVSAYAKSSAIDFIGDK